MAAVIALLLTIDGGAVLAEYRGTLEANHQYALVGEHDPARGVDLFAALRPPRLALPRHHAARVEWADEAAVAALPTGTLRVEFAVDAVQVDRVSERRWNTTFRCRLLRVVREQ